MQQVSYYKVQKIAYAVEFDEYPEWTKSFSEEQKNEVNEIYQKEMKGTCLEGVYIDN